DHGCHTLAPASAARCRSSVSSVSRPSARPQSSDVLPCDGMGAIKTVSPTNNPTCRTGGPARSRKSSAMPSWRNNARLVGERYSPQTLRRGKFAFSTTATSQPARASVSAAIAPAGPPPISSASYGSVMSVLPWCHSRDETMAEQPDCLFAEEPAPVFRPQRGQLLSVESRAHTGDRVVPGDLVAAEKPQPLTRTQGGGISSRFASGKAICPAGYQFHQPPQGGVGKMVQEQVGGDQINLRVGRACQPIEDIG